VFAGIGCNLLARAKPKLRRPVAKFFRFLHVYAIAVILPSVVFISVAKYSLSDVVGFSNAFVLGFLVMGICFVTAVGISKRVKDNRETTIALALNAGFMNVTYLGFPATYAVLGAKSLGPAALYAMAVGITHIILGTVLMTLASKRKVSAKPLVMSVITFPAVFALLAALLFVVFSAPLPSFIYQPFDSYVAPAFFALMLLLVGYQINLVSPRRYRDELISVGAFRFIISPILTYIFIIALGLNISSDLSPKPALLLSAMPPAVFNLILAHNFKRDTRIYGAMVFYLTMVFLLLVLPVMSVSVLA